MRQALRFALQLQAGKHPVLPAPPVLTAETVSASLPSSSKDEEGEGGDGASGRIGGNSPPSVTTTTADTATSVDAPSPSSPTAPPSSLVPTSQQPSSSDPQLVLSQWALDTAFSTVLKTPTPRLGRPAARSKQDISTLVTDKHERSLIGNVISPQDIGVTYDMIGRWSGENLYNCVFLV